MFYHPSQGRSDLVWRMLHRFGFSYAICKNGKRYGGGEGEDLDGPEGAGTVSSAAAPGDNDNGGKKDA